MVARWGLNDAARSSQESLFWGDDFGEPGTLAPELAARVSAVVGVVMALGPMDVV